MSISKLIVTLALAIIIVHIESYALKNYLVKYPEQFRESVYYHEIRGIIIIWIVICIPIHILLRMSFAQSTPPFMVTGFIILLVINYIRSTKLIKNPELYVEDNYYIISGNSPENLQVNFCWYCDNYQSFLCEKCEYRAMEMIRLRGQALEDFYNTLPPEGQRKFREDWEEKQRREEQLRREQEQRMREEEERRTQERKEDERLKKIIKEILDEYYSKNL